MRDICYGRKLYENFKEEMRIPEGILKLKCEKEVYLYGNGTYAKDMLDILDEFEIDIQGVLVSKEFMSDENFYGNTIYAAEPFFDNLQRDIVIVAGFKILFHKSLTDCLIMNKNVKTIYVLNGCQVFWSNGAKFFDPKIFLIDSYYEKLMKRNLDYRYFKDNYVLFEQTYDWLEDEKSKRTMEDYLKGHIELKNFPMTNVWQINDIKNQYFPEDIISLKENEVFVDCGAYTGDTLDSFFKRVKGFKKYYALEPDSRLFEVLRSKITDKVIHISVGAWERKEQLCFSAENGCGEILVENNNSERRIEVDKLDNLITEHHFTTFP